MNSATIIIPRGVEKLRLLNIDQKRGTAFEYKEGQRHALLEALNKTPPQKKLLAMQIHVDVLDPEAIMHFGFDVRFYQED